jgi:asparagine synthase (glutamine-hydrolysing)
MVGIASTHKLGRVIRETDRSVVAPLPWIAVSGEDTYETKAVCVIAHSDVYNYRELSKELHTSPRSDAGLIGELYLRYGLRVFAILHGFFSICIIDKIAHKLIAATDRFGVRPLVYCIDGDNFIFGLRIKELLSLAQDDGGIDGEALIDYLNFSAVPTPKTIYRRIRKLPPGHFLVVQGGDPQPKLTQYYDITYPIENREEEYFLRGIPESVEESVKLVLGYERAKGRRIGAFLSGGTDSSTVTGMIKKISGSVKTFSIGFDEPGYNELEYARITANHFGAEYHEYIVTPHDVLRSLDSVLGAFDEPFGNASAVPTYYCALLAKEHGVDTLLSGDGGDEIFGGNERYAANHVFSIYHRIPIHVRKNILEPALFLLPSSITLVDKGKRYIRRANIQQPERFFSYNPVSALGRETIFSPEFLSSINGYDPVAWARELYHTVQAEDELNKLLYIDMKFTITDNDLRKVNAASEEAGLRVAYPLLDHKLVDLAATMPVSFKVKGRVLRYLFKKAFAGFLPSEVIQKKKHGFGLPIGVWIGTKESISSYVRETLLSSNCTIGPFFRSGFVENLFALHRSTGSAFYGDILWLLLTLELWHKSMKKNSAVAVPGK